RNLLSALRPKHFNRLTDSLQLMGHIRLLFRPFVVISHGFRDLHRGTVLALSLPELQGFWKNMTLKLTIQIKE
ncbi:MAG: hypothetical protein HGA83_07925, partial [Bacteroidales bacterium]|nr:hypothetical protein [Bacteroidales bacterium]